MPSIKNSSKPYDSLRINTTITNKNLRPSSGSDAASTIPPAPNMTKSSGSNIYFPSVPDDVFRSNMITTKNGGLIMMFQSSDMMSQGNITVWDDSSRDLWNHSKGAEEFKVRTKDFDFSKKSTATSTGSDSGPSRRKKVYKVYVTFRCNKYMSNIKMNYAINGSDTFRTDSSGTFQDTTYYTNATGFDSYNAGTSSDDWITVGLKPSSSVNNIFSFALQFSCANAGHVGAIVAHTASNKITLVSSASAVTDYYVGMPVFFYKGPGYGQIRHVIAYNGTTKIATLDAALASGSVEPGSTLYDIGFIPSSFQINDISIIYREKSVK